jgi:hypothetical protein
VVFLEEVITTSKNTLNLAFICELRIFHMLTSKCFRFQKLRIMILIVIKNVLHSKWTDHLDFCYIDSHLKAFLKRYKIILKLDFNNNTLFPSYKSLFINECMHVCVCVQEIKHCYLSFKATQRANLSKCRVYLCTLVYLCTWFLVAFFCRKLFILISLYTYFFLKMLW